jgi:hypothetical protein
MAPAVLLWDFGDTLVDERWLHRPPESCPAWTEAWVDAMQLHADGWSDGAIGRSVVFAAVADRTGMTLADVERHAQDCCTRLELHETAWRVATEHHAPQALVTVNPDLFGDWIVPGYGLAAMFDALVISCAERTSDKNELCTIALDRLGFDGDRSDALLIDNRLDLVEAWRAQGGAAYWFQSDAQFADDVAHLLR